ncbi:MAG: hypothetical protein ACW980_22495 [Promethearchaeota archaeon]|jgi:hypothetical protein
MAVDLKKAKEDAKAEVEAEKFEIAKTTYKLKLGQLNTAKKVVANIERELVDLDLELEEGL